MTNDRTGIVIGMGAEVFRGDWVGLTECSDRTGTDTAEGVATVSTRVNDSLIMPDGPIDRVYSPGYALD